MALRERIESGKLFEARLQVDVDVLVEMECEQTVPIDIARARGRALSYDESALQRAIDNGHATVRVLGGSARFISVRKKDKEVA